LGKLGIARLYARLIELKRSSRIDPCDKRPRINLSEQLAKRLGCSRRNLDRYLRVTLTPLEVQQAFDRDQLGLVPAGRVAGLAPDEQQQIAAEIRAGGDPEAVVRKKLSA